MIMHKKFELLKAMTTIVRSMNYEEAYYWWILIVPDPCGDNDLWDVVEDEELFDDACRTFWNIQKAYGKDGYVVWDWTDRRNPECYLYGAKKED